MTETTPIAPDFVTRIRAVDGVTDVFSYPVGLARVPGVIAAATGAAEDRTTDLAVTVRDGVPTLATRIATSAGDRAPDAARRVADALLDLTPPNVRIAIQVARIH